MTMQANLTNRDATRVPHPFVKWATSRRAPRTCRPRSRRASTCASLPPHGPGVRVDADGRLDARRSTTTHVAHVDRPARSPAARCADPDGGRDAGASGCESADEPGDGRRPGRRRQRRAGTPAIALAEKQRLGVWATPAPGGGRLGFPESHPNFRGVLPPGDRPGRPDARGPRPGARRRLVGVPLLPLHPGPAAARGRASSSRSPATRTRPRARRWATRSWPTSKLTLEALVDAVGESRPRAARAARRPAAGRGLRPARAPSPVHAHAREVAARRRHRGARVADEHAGAAQPAADLAAGQLLLRRRRRPGLRPRRRDRRAARPARPPRRLRARRGLGAVRDHGLLDGRRLQACRSRS